MRLPISENPKKAAHAYTRSPPTSHPSDSQSLQDLRLNNFVAAGHDTGVPVAGSGPSRTRVDAAQAFLRDMAGKLPPGPDTK